MAQLSGIAAAVKNQQHVLVGRQFALQCFEFTVRNTDGRRDMALVIFGLFGPGVHENGLVCHQLAGYIVNRYRGITALGFHVTGKTVGINFDIGITKFFRLPGGFVAKLSGGPAAIENQQGIFILGQLVRHFIKLAVGDADGGWDVPVDKFWFIGPGIDD